MIRHSIVTATLVAVILSGRAPAQAPDIEEFFNQFTADWMRANPDAAISSRYFRGEEQARLERQLTPLTQAWRDERTAQARRGIAQLKQYDRTRLSDAQRISADVMEWMLDQWIRNEQFRDYAQFPFEQFAGVNVNLVAALTISHPLQEENDAASYLARLGQVRTRMNEAIADARRLIARNIFPPRFIVRSTLTQMRDFIAVPAAQNPFVSAFAERLASINTVTPERREQLRAEAERIVAGEVYPAWRDAIGVMTPLLQRATDDAGLWRFPAGGETYAHQLRRYTTTSLAADEVHQIGLQQVARIESQMDDILRKLGRTAGPVKERIDQLDKERAYPLTEEGRAAIMRDIDAMIADAQKRAALQFERQPRAAVVARPFPRFREANAAGSYTAPSPDGSRPGTFQIPLRPDYMTKFGLRTLVYHETVPGHHFQIALEMENEAVPMFRRIRALGGISAFSEGWGLYAERLAAESGWYEDDPEGLLGQLDDELFRARRLVVDTGLHAKRWTRQQAIDYGIEASEVERYVVNPGQACAYMIGQLKLIELREKARVALADRFSIKEYHTAVLSTGSVPLQLLEREIERFIQARK